MELTLENIKNDPYQNFVEYLSNDQTRERYLTTLKKFLNVIPKKIFEENLQKSGETVPELATLFVELAKKDGDLVKRIIHAYVRELKNDQKTNNTKNSTLKNQLKPIVSLFAANDVGFSWKLLNKGIPPAEIPKDRSYTIEELQLLMLAASDIVDKIIILLFSSAGFRLGAWDYLTWNDVIFFKNEDGSAKGLGLKIYAGDAEEYWTHGTPEAEKMLLLYREEWKKRFGKYPEKSDPLLTSTRIRAILRISSIGVSGRVRNLLKRSGLKEINVQADNGFRKYFNTMCRRAKVFEEDREDMMGHYEGLQKHYERYVEEDFERFSEYQKAIPLLTISDEDRAKAQLILECKKSEDVQKKDKLQQETIKLLKKSNKELRELSTQKRDEDSLELDPAMARAVDERVKQQMAQQK